MNKPNPSQGSFRHSIAFRYLFVTVGTILASGLISGAIVVYSSIADQITTIQQNVSGQATFLKAVMPEAVYSGDFLTLETLMRQTAETPEIVYSVVLSNDGAPLTRYLNRTDPLIAQAIARADQTTPLDILDILAAVDANADTRTITYPISTDGVLLGQVKLGYTVGDIWGNMMRTMVNMLIATLALSLLVAVLIGGIFRLQVGRPLQEITDLAQALADGDLSRRAAMKLDGRSGNELDRLKQAFNSMADRLEETLDGLRLSQKQTEKLSMVASRTDNMVVISDASGRIEWVNKAFERITEYAMAEVVGRTPGSILQGPDSDPEVIDYMRSQISAQAGFTCELINYSKTGQRYWIAVEVQPVWDEQGVLTNFIALESDITERKAADEALRQAKEEAEMANKAKSIFLANMSHELRTPLNAIIGYSELLIEDAELEEDFTIAGDLGRIQSAGKHLLALISDILDLSKIEAGRMEVYLEPFDMRGLIEAVSETITSLIQKNQNQLILDLVLLQEPMVSDMIKLRQILFNLLSNAAKFTEAGTVTVRLCQLPGQVAKAKVAEHQDTLTFPTLSDPDLVQEIADTPWICLTVTDTGIGMSPEQLRSIFHAFDQGDPSTTRRYEGTGLGLAIVHRFCHMLGGAVWVESILGQGTTFWVWLPQNVQPAPQASITLGTLRPSQSNNQSIQ